MTDMTPRPVIDSMLDAIITVGKDAQALSYNGDTWDNIERRARERLYKAVDGQRTLDTPVMERLRTQADTPRVAPGPDVYPLVGNPTPWRVRTVTIPSWRGPGQPKAVRHELLNDNGRIVGNIRNEGVAHEVVRLVNSGGAVALELVDKYHKVKLEKAAQDTYIRELERIIDDERLRVLDAETIRAAQVDRLMGERDNWEQVAKLNEDARTTWMNTARNTAQERDKALDAYNTLRQCMVPPPYDSRLAELEARNIELRQMLEQTQGRLESMERDRDGYRKGAQFWMDGAKEARAKVVKLRTVLEEVKGYLPTFSAGFDRIRNILEQTK